MQSWMPVIKIAVLTFVIAVPLLIAGYYYGADNNRRLALQEAGRQDRAVAHASPPVIPQPARS